MERPRSSGYMQNVVDNAWNEGEALQVERCATETLHGVITNNIDDLRHLQNSGSDDDSVAEALADGVLETLMIEEVSINDKLGIAFFGDDGRDQVVKEGYEYHLALELYDICRRKEGWQS